MKHFVSVFGEKNFYRSIVFDIVFDSIYTALHTGTTKCVYFMSCACDVIKLLVHNRSLSDMAECRYGSARTYPIGRLRVRIGPERTGTAFRFFFLNRNGVPVHYF